MDSKNNASMMHHGHHDMHHDHGNHHHHMANMSNMLLDTTNPAGTGPNLTGLMDGHHDHSGHHDHMMHHNTSMEASSSAMDGGGMHHGHHGHEMMMDHHGSGGGGHHGGGGHSMTFHFGYNEFVLFNGWHITTIAGLVGSCLGIILLAALYEVLKFYREKLYQVGACRCNAKSNRHISEAGHDLSGRSADQPMIDIKTNGMDHKCPVHAKTGILGPMNLHHLLHTIIHMIQFLLAYLLMLIFMTYNVWLCFAVIIGSGIGFFAVGWKRSTPPITEEHCC